jgi:hypothetical protein
MTGGREGPEHHPGPPEVPFGWQWTAVFGEYGKQLFFLEIRYLLFSIYRKQALYMAIAIAMTVIGRGSETAIKIIPGNSLLCCIDHNRPGSRRMPIKTVAINQTYQYRNTCCPQK